MKRGFRLYSLLLTVLSTMVWVPPSVAQELCGSHHETVCLQGNSRVSFVNNTPLASGSRIVLILPGLSVNNRYEVSGSVEVPFRFDDHGSVIDSLNGTWSDLQVLARDNRGLTAIAFTLEQTAATDTALDIEINAIRVCQQISDGPGDVNLTVLFFQNTNPAKALEVQRKNQALSAFRDCSTYAGNLPLFQESDTLYLVNPHDERVWVTLDDERFSMAAYDQRAVDARYSGQALTFSCNRPLVTALVGNDGDLAATTMTTTVAKDWLVPHLARNNASWSNQWIFSGQSQVSLSWAQGDNNGGALYQAGSSALTFQPDPLESAGWLRLHDNVGHNGYFQFAALDGIGKAWVGGERVDPRTDLGHQRLFMPHIALDRVNFWSGLSLANAGAEDANAVLKGYDGDGMLLAEQALVVPASANSLGVIGEQFFPKQSQVAWLEIESDRAVTGTALLGSRSGEGVAGLLLPNQGGSRLVFPVLQTADNDWSGVVLVNTAENAAILDVTWRAASGTVLERENLTLAAKAKATRLAPAGAAYALVNGDTTLLGYGFIGRLEDGALAGYPAEVFLAE